MEDKFCVFCFFLEAVAAKFSTQYVFLLKRFKLFVVELSPTGACQAEKSGSSTALRQLFWKAISSGEKLVGSVTVRFFFPGTFAMDFFVIGLINVGFELSQPRFYLSGESF